jgi:hypothetical protein
MCRPTAYIIYGARRSAASQSLLALLLSCDIVLRRVTSLCNHLITMFEFVPQQVSCTCPAGVLLMACSTDPFHLVDAGVAAAAALSGGAAPRAAKQLPASLDGFGW